MECVSIQSRLISSAAYYRREGKLCVWFNSGQCVWHDNVSDAMFQNLAKAESAGLYYSNYIAGRRRHQERKASRLPKMAVFALLSVLMVGVSGAVITSGTKPTALMKSEFNSYANASTR
jgi:hypothetical protein